MEYQLLNPDEPLAQKSGINNSATNMSKNNNIISSQATSSKKPNIASGDIEKIQAVDVNDKNDEANTDHCKNENHITSSEARETQQTRVPNESATRDQANDLGNSSGQNANDSNEKQSESQQDNQQTQSRSVRLPTNNRSILILREIDPNVQASLVKEIFDSENCPSRPVNCEHALQNSWYVTFKNNEDASLALAFIRKHVITWQGRPIMARYKPKPAVPSAVNQPPTIHHHQQQRHVQVAPQMVIHEQQMRTVATTTVASTSAQQVASSSGVTNRQDSLYTMSMVQSVPTSVSNLDQSTMLSHHNHQAGFYGLPPTDSTAMMQMVGDPAHLVHNHLPGAHPHYGYSAVAYYGQHGPVMTPWSHYTSGPQFDLSEVFIYNGLAPYPSPSKTGNQKASGLSGVATISSAALLGTPPTDNNDLTLSYHNNNRHNHNQHHTHHHHHQQHYHNHRNNNAQQRQQRNQAISNQTHHNHIHSHSNQKEIIPSNGNNNQESTSGVPKRRQQQPSQTGNNQQNP